MKRVALLTMVLVAMPQLAFGQDKPPANWDAPLCKPVDREAQWGRPGH